MENGRHVITEKPIALTLEQANTMIETAKKHKVKLAVSHQYRDIPHHRRYRHLVQSNAFGGPIFVRIVDIREVRPKLAMHRQSVNGGPVIDLGVHYYDAIRFYTGDEPESVLAKGHIFGKGKKWLSGLSDLAIDAAEVLVSMSGGHTLSFFVNWGMPEGFPTISYELLSGSQLSIHYNNGVVVANYPDHKQTWNDFRGNLFSPDLRIDDFVCSIKDNRDPDVSGHEARKALRVGCAALESMKTGQVVKL
jgi:predicted dehydrogenase